MEIPFIQTSAELQSFECNNHNDLHVKLKAWGPDAARRFILYGPREFKKQLVKSKQQSFLTLEIKENILHWKKNDQLQNYLFISYGVVTGPWPRVIGEDESSKYIGVF